MPLAIETFRSIPQELLCKRPQRGLSAPAFTFGHLVRTERTHVGRFLEGVDDAPAINKIFGRTAPDTWCLQGDVEEGEIAEAMGTRESLISYWSDVRGATHRYLDSISDEDLKVRSETTLLGESDPSREDPIREFFVKTIQHQNYNWGQLIVAARLLGQTV